MEDVHLAVVYKNLDGNNIVVNIWRKPNTDTAYFFLPSFVQMQNGSFQSRHEYVIGEHVVTDGSSTGFFEMDSCYKFIGACNKCNSINYLFFLRSENIGSIHLTCRQKTEEKKIHSDRNYKATVSTSLYNYDGSLLYENNNVKINCRGNSTWRPPKKAYVLTLPQNARLMDMPEGKKWLLLANAFDESNIRNAIVLDFAENLGLAWTPKYDFVDVYLNGDYRGVYMLTEKIEISSSRLNISSSDGGGIFFV